MARGNRQSEGRAARSEGLNEGLGERFGYKPDLPARGQVVFDWQKPTLGNLSVPSYVSDKLVEQAGKMMANIKNAQSVLAKQDRKELIRMVGGEENARKVDDMIERGVMTKDLLRKDGVIDRQERFNKALKEAGDTPLSQDDPVLRNAVESYYASMRFGSTPTYEMAGGGGNGYAKTRSFEPVYNKELKAWELVRYGNPLLNSDDPKDFVTEKGWYAVKGSPNNKTLETKLKKVAIVMNTFIED
jgi:hypothetical protein